MNLTRRTFLKTGAAALSSTPLLSAFANVEIPQSSGDSTKIWGILLHLGHNMWGDAPTAYTPPVDHFTCDEELWVELTQKVAESGLNLIVVDIGEAIQYKSHPEIAIKGAWSIEKLREDIARLRKLGLQVIPKLNFSTCHDFWLGEYAKMVSTRKYYDVCADLIKEVAEIFDFPKFFHIGYDEEAFRHQRSFDYIVIRQGELWKHDFLFFIEQCEKNNVRPWIWADYAWDHKDFYDWAPKSIVMSNWYYGTDFNPKTNPAVQSYLDYDKAGFEQIPTGSNFSDDSNFGSTVKFCKENLSDERLLGFLQAPWKFTEKKDREYHLRSIQQVKEVLY